jgi:ribosomal protein L40E
MTELLTESFCERCGTRYTFQTAAPKQGRLTRLRVMSKGLRRYVLDDETTLEDAFADARSEEDRAISSQQLEAFHQTFNFCMSCRQYTCGNCWNTTEARCLTCAPDLAHEVMPAPFPDATPQVAATGATTPEAWPEADLQAELAAAAIAGQDASPAEPVEDVSHDRLAAVLGLSAAPAPGAVPPAPPAPIAPPGSGSPAGAELAGSWDEALGPDGLAAAASLAAAGPAIPVTVDIDETAQVAADAGQPDAGIVASPPSPEERAAAAAAATGALLGRFRPGQNLDDVLAAYEHEHPDETPEAPSVEAPVARAMPAAQAAAMPEAEPAVAPAAEPALAAAVEPGLVAGAQAAAEPTAEETLAAEPTLAAEIEPTVEETLAAEPAMEPPAAPSPQGPPAVPTERRDDRVELPVWSIVAPEAETPPTPPLPAIQPQPRALPEWPTLQADATPQWPTDPFTASGAAARAQDVLWAASSAEVSQKAVAVRSCGSCGLSLSATARFCRRCGSRQD